MHIKSTVVTSVGFPNGSCSCPTLISPLVRLVGTYRAPSWSWASMDEPLMFFNHVSEAVDPVSRISAVKIQLVDNSNNYGQIRSAELAVCGPIFDISWHVSGKTYPDMPDHFMLFWTGGRLFDSATIFAFF